MKDTIKSTSQIDKMFKVATRVKTPGLIALVQERHDAERNTDQDIRGHQGRVAFIAGKRLGSSPLRSRAKRRLRAAVQDAGGPWSGHDVVLIARETTTTRPYPRLLDDVATVARRLGGGRDE